jgi:MFS family permease
MLDTTIVAEAPRTSEHRRRSFLSPAKQGAAVAAFMLGVVDLFVMLCVLQAIGTRMRGTVFAVVLSLVMRLIGAVIFCRAAHRDGLRPTLMVVLALYSVLELATALSPDLAILIGVRVLFGTAIGGMWGIGAALAMHASLFGRSLRRTPAWPALRPSSREGDYTRV